MTSSILDIGDGGLLSGDPCIAPCFWGIVPGKTTKSEVASILSQLNMMSSCTVVDDYQFAIADGIGGWDCQLFATITFWKQEEIINQVGFSPTEPITLDEFISYYGPPNVFVILDVGLPEAPRYNAYLYYTEVGISISLPDQYGSKYVISPTMLIYGVSYLDEISLADEVSTFDEYVVPWKGLEQYP